MSNSSLTGEEGPTRPTRSNHQVCDLSAALQRMGGNIPLLKQVAELYREDVPELLGKLEAAMSAGLASGVRHAAHSIKGLVVNFNAEGAATAAQRLEEIGHGGDLTQGWLALRCLRKEIGRLDRALAEELARL